MSKGTYEGRMPIIDDFCDSEPRKEVIFNGYKVLFTEEEYNQAKFRDMLPCICHHCQKTFLREKRGIYHSMNRNQKFLFCSQKCLHDYSHSISVKSHPDTIECEWCHKTIKWDASFGEHRFCSKKCSRSYSSAFGHTTETSKKRSASLKQFHLEHPKHILTRDPLKSILSEKEYQSVLSYAAIVESIMNKWSKDDALKMLGITGKKRRYISKRIVKKDNENFLSSQCPATIELCRLVLNKPLKSGSISIQDCQSVKYLIATSIDKGKSLKDIFYQNNAMHLVPSLVRERNKLGSFANDEQFRSMILSMEEARKTYYNHCLFIFDESLYPFILGYELFQEHGTYNRISNPHGVEKDHRISKRYGWEHGIDPEIIRHPANCEFLPRKLNSDKHEKCSISLETLLMEINNWNH